jgi:hypothetical protein
MLIHKRQQRRTCVFRPGQQRCGGRRNAHQRPSHSRLQGITMLTLIEETGLGQGAIDLVPTTMTLSMLLPTMRLTTLALVSSSNLQIVGKCSVRSPVQSAEWSGNKRSNSRQLLRMIAGDTRISCAELQRAIAYRQLELKTTGRAGERLSEKSLYPIRSTFLTKTRRSGRLKRLPADLNRWDS